MRVLGVAVIACLLAATAMGQGKVASASGLDCQKITKACLTLATEHLAKIDSLQKENEQWKTWYNQNWPQLKAENDRLNAENSQTAFRIFVVFMGVGAGLFAGWASVKAIRRYWPISKQRRQLITLLFVATWVTVAALLALSDARLTYHPVNLTLVVFVYSLPALAFGGIGVWWFGRTKPETLF